MNSVLARFPLVAAFSGWMTEAVRQGGLWSGVRQEAHRCGGRGEVCLVGAGTGAADLITLRGRDRLRRADVVFYDRLADPALMLLARRGARLVDVGKAPGCHPVPQDRINALLVEAALAGLRVVRLKCGDPGIFGRGAEEAAACAEAGVRCEVVPGVTSASAAAAATGGFLTERGRTDRVVFITGHGSDGPKADWGGTAASGTTLVVYMGLSAAPAIAAGLLAEGWPPGAEVEVVVNAQRPDQAVLHMPLRGLTAGCGGLRALGPAIILIRWPLTCGIGQAQLAARGDQPVW